MAILQSRYQRLFQFSALAGDLLWLNAAFFFSAFLRFDEMKLQETSYYDYYVQLFVFFNLLWLLLTLILRNHDIGITLVPRRSVSKTLNVYFLHLFVLLLLLVSLKRDEYSRLFLTYFYVTLFVTIILWRFFFTRLVKSWRGRGLALIRVLLVGEDERLEPFARLAENRSEYGMTIAGKIASKDTDRLNELTRDMEVDEVVCGFQTGDPRITELFHWAEQRGLRFKLLPDLGLKRSHNWSVGFYDNIPVLSMRREPLELWHNQLLKRISDVLISGLILLVTVPVLYPLIMLGVKLSSRGPVFFVQKRTGYRNKVFKIYKFRTMRVNSEADRKQARENDERITPFGRFLRASHLDELPQFWNVLKGEMSVVGPRPHMLNHTEAYRQLIDEYLVRHLVKPGITGLSQVRGLSGEHTPAEMEERVKTDVYYIENWSLLLDFSIILQTVFRLGKS